MITDECIGQTPAHSRVRLTASLTYGKLEVYTARFRPQCQGFRPALRPAGYLDLPSGKILAVADTNGPKVHTKFLYHRAH